MKSFCSFIYKSIRFPEIHEIAKPMLAAIAIQICTSCTYMFYQPDDIDYIEKSGRNLNVEDHAIITEDGEILHGMLLRSLAPTPRGLIVHFHGNAQNMTSHFFYVNWLADYGYDVLGFDYRGYGKSSGESDQEGLHKDGRAALSYALGLEQYSDKDVYVIAQSLGGAVAVPVIAAAQTSRIRAVVIDSSFYSYRAVGQSKIEQLKLFNFLSSPLSYLVSENYSPAKVKNAFNLPLLVIHGTSDAVVPYSQGKILFDALHNPKNSKQTFISIAEGQHTDGLLRPGIQKDLLNFLCLSSLNPDNCSDPHQLRANLNFKKSEP